MNDELTEGYSELTVAINEATFTKSRDVYIMSVPVARHQGGVWQDGGTVYTTFDADGLVSEAKRWFEESVRAAHNIGEGA
jgi:hypothetical protein